jgi:hypothetical protein
VVAPAREQRRQVGVVLDADGLTISRQPSQVASATCAVPPSVWAMSTQQSSAMASSRGRDDGLAGHADRELGFVVGACNRLTSSMQSPPASSLDRTVSNVRPGRQPRVTLPSISRSRPNRPINVPVSSSPALATARWSSKVAWIESRGAKILAS